MPGDAFSLPGRLRAHRASSFWPNVARITPKVGVSAFRRPASTRLARTLRHRTITRTSHRTRTSRRTRSTAQPPTFGYPFRRERERDDGAASSLRQRSTEALCLGIEQHLVTGPVVRGLLDQPADAPAEAIQLSSASFKTGVPTASKSRPSTRSARSNTGSRSRGRHRRLRESAAERTR